MGLPMAKRLHKAGFNIRGFDIRAISPTEAGEVPICRAAALSECEILISVVRDTAETERLCFDDQQVFRNQHYPAVLVVCSTLPPSYLVSLRDKLPGSVELIDAPMSGAPKSAREASLTFMLGGGDGCLDRLDPLFRAMGKHIVRAGSLGSGMTLKVLNNYVAATSVVAVRRVLGVAENSGISTALLRDVMSKSSGSTWFGNEFEQIDWANENYAANNTIEILEKDVKCALDVIASVEDNGDDAEFDDAVLNALKRL